MSVDLIGDFFVCSPEEPQENKPISEEASSVSAVAIPLLLGIGTVLLLGMIGFSWPLAIGAALGFGAFAATIFAVSKVFGGLPANREMESFDPTTYREYLIDQPNPFLGAKKEDFSSLAPRIKGEIHKIGGFSGVHVEERGDEPEGGAKKCKQAIIISDKDQTPQHLIARLKVVGNEEIKRVKQEIGFLQTLQRSPGIVQFIGVEEKNSKSGKQKLSLYLPWYDGGDLLEFGTDNLFKLPRAQKIKIAKQLLEGLAAMHRRGISHNDIKFENILIRLLADGSFDVAICDFDLALSNESPLNVGGTLGWCSPEKLAIAEGFEPIETFSHTRNPADVWALGLVLYVLFTGETPCIIQDVNSKKGTQWKEYLTQNRQNQGSFFDEPQDQNSLEHCIWQMLRLNHINRITAEEALQGFINHGAI